MIAKELERAGIPTVQISTMTPIAIMVGANRVIRGAGIVHPVGNVELDPKEERVLRREIVLKALRALETTGASNAFDK
ncbi:MAG: glycine/betaine/sarcosine/D-proline family reductase selenoprotein B [Deltaproteobacteria bacterium]|nr:glycine/betaine/sarcosine/D-proline family reductase selenoprotein B [Deltaproteobacteria bacterium]